LARSRSHLVASRIGRLAALDSSAMSAIDEIPQCHRRRCRLFRLEEASRNRLRLAP
jgi:hypothetical protein